MLAERVSDSRNPYMRMEHVLILWTLMVMQEGRRLWESFKFAKVSKSTMWIGHYLMGHGFYMLINIAIWIEIVRMFEPAFVLVMTMLRYGIKPPSSVTMKPVTLITSTAPYSTVFACCH